MASPLSRRFGRVQILFHDSDPIVGAAMQLCRSPSDAAQPSVTAEVVTHAAATIGTVTPATGLRKDDLDEQRATNTGGSADRAPHEFRRTRTGIGAIRRRCPLSVCSPAASKTSRRRPDVQV